MKGMIITICGSVKFAKELVETYRKLEEMRHRPMMHDDMFRMADGTAKELILGIAQDYSEVEKKQYFIRWWHNCIKNSEAILVCNFDKNGIKNYIGGNTLMEMGFAHVNGKKIFLLNPIPEEVPYKDEIKAMAEVILNGDLTKIS